MLSAFGTSLPLLPRSSQISLKENVIEDKTDLLGIRLWALASVPIGCYLCYWKECVQALGQWFGFIHSCRRSHCSSRLNREQVVVTAVRVSSSKT